MLEESDHHPVPGAPVQLPPQGYGLGSAAEVEPAAETPRHELQLQEVVVTSVVEIEQETVRLQGPELQLQAGVGAGEPLGELCIGGGGSLQHEGRDL